MRTRRPQHSTFMFQFDGLGATGVDDAVPSERILGVVVGADLDGPTSRQP